MEYCPETLEKRIKEDFTHEPESAFPVPPQHERTPVTIVGDTMTTGEHEGVLEEPLDVEFNLEPILTIVDEITSALRYIHSQKMVHRDLKPRNGTLRYIYINY